MKIWDSNSFEAEPPMTLRVGGGRSVYVYEVAARMNHACVPNTTRDFTQDSRPQIVFQALQDIKKGEGIFTDYGGACGNVQLRRHVLSSKYGFTCRCKACASNRTIKCKIIDDLIYAIFENVSGTFDQGSAECLTTPKSLSLVPKPS
jgi:hypothetical protein